jgi:hypothetical protein
VGLTEAEAVQLYEGIKARLESIIRDRSNAELRSGSTTLRRAGQP